MPAPPLLHGWTEDEAGELTGIIPSSIRSHVKYLRKIDRGKKVEPAKDDVQSYEAFRRRLGSQVREDVISFPDRPPYPNESRDMLLSTLSSATKSLGICIWNISCEALVNLVVGIHNRTNSSGERAVAVGVVTDSVIDNKLLLNGRYDWSKAAGIRNHENIVITDSKALIPKFTKEFERLFNH